MFHAIEVSLDKKPGMLRFDNIREFPLNALKDMQHANTSEGRGRRRGYLRV